MAKMSWKTPLLLFVILYALSCQKHDDNEQVDPITNIEYATASDISNLKEWLNSKKSILTMKDQARLDSLINVLNWEKTAITNANNEILFVTPVNELLTDKAQTSFNLVIFKNSKEGYHFSTLFKLQNNQHQKINNVEFLTDLISNKKNNYSCNITAYTPSGYPAYEYKIVNGQFKTKANVSKRNPTTGSGNRINECTSWYWVTHYDDGSSDWTYLFTLCDGDGDPVCNETRIMNSRSQRINCGGGSGGFATEEQLMQTFLDRIENLLQHQCLSDVLNLLKALNNGKIAQIIQQFSGEIPNWNWKLQEGTVNGPENAKTDPLVGGTITTTFDYSKLNQATELSLARTMMHEAIHAYLTAYFANDPQHANLEYDDMLEEWQKAKNPSYNTVQHNEMVRSFVGEIAASLKEFGLSRGYNLSDQFYNDMAWGGLTRTDAFQNLDQVDQDRISERLDAENTTAVVGNQSPSNTKACN